MTRQDVLEMFKEASEAVKNSGIEFDQETLGGIVLQLTDRLLQANEIEQNERKLSPVIAGQGTSNVRSFNQ